MEPHSSTTTEVAFGQSTGNFLIRLPPPGDCEMWPSSFLALVHKSNVCGPRFTHGLLLHEQKPTISSSIAWDDNKYKVAFIVGP